MSSAHQQSAFTAVVPPSMPTPLQTLSTLTGHITWIFVLAFLLSERVMASGGDAVQNPASGVSSYERAMYSMSKGSVAQHQLILGSLEGHRGKVFSIAFSRDGNILASGGEDESVILWDVATQRRIGEALSGHQRWVYGIAFSPDGKLLASAGADGSVILWVVETRLPRGEPLKGDERSAFSVTFSPDGKFLASGGEGGVTLWDVATGSSLRKLGGPQSTVYSVAFSPDGQILASGTSDDGVILWDMATGKQLGQPLKGHQKVILNASEQRESSVYSIAFSPDGKTLASGSEDSTVILWNMATRERVGKPLTAYRYGGLWSVAFSPDASTVAAGGSRKSLILWDAVNYKRRGDPLGTNEFVWAVAFSPNGKIFASASSDSVTLWDGAAATARQFVDDDTLDLVPTRALKFGPPFRLLLGEPRLTTHTQSLDDVVQGERPVLYAWEALDMLIRENLAGRFLDPSDPRKGFRKLEDSLQQSAELYDVSRNFPAVAFAELKPLANLNADVTERVMMSKVSGEKMIGCVAAFGKLLRTLPDARLVEQFLRDCSGTASAPTAARSVVDFAVFARFTELLVFSEPEIDAEIANRLTEDNFEDLRQRFLGSSNDSEGSRSIQRVLQLTEAWETSKRPVLENFLALLHKSDGQRMPLHPITVNELSLAANRVKDAIRALPVQMLCKTKSSVAKEVEVYASARLNLIRDTIPFLPASLYGPIGGSAHDKRLDGLKVRYDIGGSTRFEPAEAGNESSGTIVIGGMEIKALCAKVFEAKEFDTTSALFGRLVGDLERRARAGTLGPFEFFLGAEGKDVERARSSAIKVDEANQQVVEALDFLIGHELGHFVLDKTHPGEKLIQETQADLFGAFTVDAAHPSAGFRNLLEAIRASDGKLPGTVTPTDFTIFQSLPGAVALMAVFTNTDYERRNQQRSHPLAEDRLRFVRDASRKFATWGWSQ